MSDSGEFFVTSAPRYSLGARWCKGEAPKINCNELVEDAEGRRVWEWRGYVETDAAALDWIDHGATVPVTQAEQGGEK